MHLADTTDVRTLRRDPWFTRGWTLQELLAPKRVKFFGKSWQPITTNSLDNDKDSKLKHPLWDHISDITNISRPQILDFKPGIHHARDALVWVSKRQTTRTEDMAYCLIGLLGVPLSIAYGEGQTAFYRLQVEILQRSHDMRLFTWQGQPSIDNSMLAAGPHCFSSLSTQPLFSRTPTDVVDLSYTLTNYGLRIPLSVYSVPSGMQDVGVGVSGNPKMTLEVAGLGHITVELQTRENYESVEVAVLGEVASQSSDRKNGLAILIGFKDSQWKRITTRERIILSCPIDTAWRTPQIKFVE